MLSTCHQRDVALSRVSDKSQTLFPISVFRPVLSSVAERSTSSASAGVTLDSANIVSEPARSVSASGDPSAACLPRGEQGGKGAGRGLTAPYRLLCEAVSSPGELDRHFLR